MKKHAQSKKANNSSVQAKAKNQVTKGSILQAYKNGTAQLAVEEEEPAQLKENKTGLPDQLKSGVESLSGHSMSDVKVHYNSSKPAELQAHAYAQGTDIHVAPGQEKHLPHEAWHVAQQKQGRVQPTKQLKGATNINDDAGLEKEADVMGAKAESAGNQAEKTPAKTSESSATNTAQLIAWQYNSATNRFFDIQHLGETIVATEVTLSKKGNNAVSKTDGHSGLLKYHIFEHLGEKYMLLEHIKSHPEEGSGLGALLVKLMAEKAMASGVTIMVVSKPATDQQGFYSHMGYNVEGAKEQVRNRYRELGREDDIPKDINIPEARATPQEIFDNSNASVSKRWRSFSPTAELPSGERRDPDFGQSTRLVEQISNDDL